MSTPFLPYGRQSISDDDIAAVTAVLRSDFLTQGPEVERFEASLRAACGAKHAIAYSHGTAALFGACWAAGVGPGDEVVTSAITFAASANCAAYLGALPVFADVRADTCGVDVASLERAITPKTKVLIPVDFTGQPADLAQVHALAKQRGLLVIEDAAHSLGAVYQGEPVGCGHYADMTMLSFHPVKHITTGEGGAVLTNDDNLAHRLRLFRNHGIERDESRFVTQPSPGPWYHEMQELGHNFRLTDLQAALGRSQMTRLPAFVARRREIAALYDKLLADLPRIRPLAQLPDRRSSYHLYAVQIDLAAAGKDRAQVMHELRQLGVGSQVHYIPVYRHPFHQRNLAAAGRAHRPEQFPNAEAYYAGALSLPMYPALADEDVVRVVDGLRQVVG